MVLSFHHNKLMIVEQEKKAGYGVYNQSKNIELAIKLPGLQNILEQN